MSVQPNDSASRTSSSNLSRQTGLYALAAAAAGVSLLSMVQPASGEVIVTKKTIPIPVAPPNMPHTVNISMANNGIDNFSFTLFYLPPSAGRASSFRGLNMGGASIHAGAIAGGGFKTYTPALARGAQIGPSATFANGNIIEDSYAGVSFRAFLGDWGGNPKDRYVGVRFLIAGQTHYGWIRLTVTTNPQPSGPAMSAKITGYAYETVPNKVIRAGTAERPTATVQATENIQSQSGPSLGVLALGADGLPMWRREGTSPSR